MASSINASLTAGVVTTADTSGVLQLQTAGTTAISIDASQAVSFTNAPTVTGGTANGVAYLNGSKVLTTGSALVFDGTNLGVGVTPSAWSGSFKVLQLANGTSLSNNGQTSYYQLGANNYFDGTDYKYIASNYAGFHRFSNLGDYEWHNAPSGTAGNAISFTQAMTLDASGRLGIGTTTMSTSENLVVSNGTVDLVMSPGAFSSGNTAMIGTKTNHAISFAINTAQKMVLDTSGNLLVGGTTAGSTSPGIGLTPNGGGSGNGLIYCTGTATTSAASTYFMYSSGAAAYRFYVDFGGTIHATSTSISAISDASLKTNIKDLETGLTEVMALKPRRFDWINGDATNVAGFIAQEVEQVLPELVIDSLYSNDENGNEIKKKNLKMGDILPTLVKAIQEQQALITQLQADVALLKGA